MKGLIYSWGYSKKIYFIISALLFAVTCGAMIIVIPLLNLEENEYIRPLSGVMLIFLQFAIMGVCGESLNKDLEDMLKTGFAGYALTGGISKRGFVNTLLVRNLICCGFSLVTGSAVTGLYLLLKGEQIGWESLLFVPFIVLLIYSVDFLITPLVLKFKNTEKAGFALGLGIGVIVFIFMITVKMTGNETIINMNFNPFVMGAVIGILILLYIPAYLITLKMLKRGNVC